MGTLPVVCDQGRWLSNAEGVLSGIISRNGVQVWFAWVTMIETLTREIRVQNENNLTSMV